MRRDKVDGKDMRRGNGDGKESKKFSTKSERE